MNISGTIILLGCAIICVYAIQRFMARKIAVRRFRRSMGDVDSFQPRGKVDRQIQAKLTRLLGGNQKTINRLLEQSRFKNSDRPEQWHWEKVLYDLERDRWR